MKTHQSNPLGISSRQVPMRSTASSCLSQCERKFMFRERYGLVPRANYQAALVLGELVHLYITTVFRTGDEEAGRAGVKMAVARQQATIVESLTGGRKLTKRDSVQPEWATQQMEALAQDAKKAEMMGRIFVDKFMGTVGNMEVVSEFIEAPLHWEMPDREVPLAGRLDLVLRDKKTGKYWIWDLKTMSAKFSSLNRAAMFKQDVQPWFYKLLLTQALRERGYKGHDGKRPSVAGVIHVIYQKPGPQFCGKDKTFDDYVVRCKKDFYELRFAEVRAGTRKDGPPVLVSKLPLGRVPGWVMTRINQLEYACSTPICDNIGAPLDTLKDKSFFSKWAPNCTACFDYNTECAYLPLCKVSEELWPRVVANHYLQSFRQDEEENR